MDAKRVEVAFVVPFIAVHPIDTYVPWSSYMGCSHVLRWQLSSIPSWGKLPGLVNKQKAIENSHWNSEFSHLKWWFPTVFCMFTRGYMVLSSHYFWISVLGRTTPYEAHVMWLTAQRPLSFRLVSKNFCPGTYMDHVMATTGYHQLSRLPYIHGIGWNMFTGNSHI